LFKRIVSGITLTLLLIGMLTLAFGIQPVKVKTTPIADDCPGVFASNSSEIEIYYDNNASNPGGLGGSLPGGSAVNFTPPSEEYWMLKRVKFYGMRWANESYDNMPFYIEIWDKNRNELLHLVYKYSDYFKNYDFKWVTVDIPDVLVKDDFFVCIFPNMIYNPSGPSPHMNIGFNNDPPISNRSYRVRMDDNSIEWQVPGNIFIRAIVSSVLTATVNIYPQALNLRSRGKWITTYIELPEGYDIHDINFSSIMLEESVPAELRPVAIGDYDEDSIPDLMVKFDRAEIISYVLANVNMTELFEERFMTITLTITGYLNDDTMFMGSDTIKIIMPMPRCSPRCWRFMRTLLI